MNIIYRLDGLLLRVFNDDGVVIGSYRFNYLPRKDRKYRTRVIEDMAKHLYRDYVYKNHLRSDMQVAMYEDDVKIVKGEYAS